MCKGVVKVPYWAARCGSNQPEVLHGIMIVDCAMRYVGVQVGCDGQLSSVGRAAAAALVEEQAQARSRDASVNITRIGL